MSGVSAPSSPLVPVAAVVASLSAWAAYKYWRFWENTRKNALGLSVIEPPRFPLGNLHMMGNILACLTRIYDSRDLKTGLTGFWLMDEEVLVPHKAEHAHQILQSTTYRKTVPSLAKHFRSYLGERNVFVAMQEEWRFHRGLLSKPFHFAKLKTMASTITGVTARLMEHVHSLPADQPVDMLPLLRMATMDAIGLTVFGYNFGCVSNAAHGQPQEMVAFEYLLAEHTRRLSSMMPWDCYYNFPSLNNLRHRRYRNIVRRPINSMIKQRREMQRQKALKAAMQANGNGVSNGNANGNGNGHHATSNSNGNGNGHYANGVKGESSKEEQAQEQNGHGHNINNSIVVTGNDDDDDPADFLSVMLSARDDEGRAFTDEDLSDELIGLMFAGFDTTSLALSFAVHILATHPEIQAELHAEVDNVLGGRLPTHDDVSALKYTTQVLKETLRLYPPAPMALRNLTTELKLGDDFVAPAGTRVWVPIISIHRSAMNWEQPLEVRPERFAPANVIKPGAWIPFSGGARNCIGMRFALLEATLMLAILAQNFTYTALPNEKKLKESLFTGVVMKPVGGVRVMVTPRQHL